MQRRCRLRLNNKMEQYNLISPKSFALRLDCSVSMVYKLRKSDPDFPEPEVKLFGKSKRGWRWTEEQYQKYRAIKSPRLHEPELEGEAAPVFVPLKLKKVA